MIYCDSGFDFGKASVPASVPVPAPVPVLALVSNPNLELDQHRFVQFLAFLLLKVLCFPESWTLIFFLFVTFLTFVFHLYWILIQILIRNRNAFWFR
jgi:hypothetical protein